MITYNETWHVTDNSTGRAWNNSKDSPFPTPWVSYGSMKTVSCHNANSVITGGTGDCHYNNLWCHEWLQSWHYDSPWSSVIIGCLLWMFWGKRLYYNEIALLNDAISYGTTIMLFQDHLTLKQLGFFSKCNSFSNVFPLNLIFVCNICNEYLVITANTDVLVL